MAGAALCFFIARVMGREVVEKLTGKTVLDSMDGFSLATANIPSWYVGYCLLSLLIQSAMLPA